MGTVDNLVAELEKSWPGQLPDEERVQFNSWEPARKELALARLQAVCAYHDRRQAVDTIMSQLQVGKSQFYKLVRDWNYKNSLSSIVPHARKRHSPVRTSPEIVVIIEDLLEKHGADSRITEMKLIKLIQQKAQEKGMKAPADSTVRRLIARTVTTKPDAVYFSSGLGRQVEAMLTAFGGQVLVDYSTIDILCRENGHIIRPTVGVVIDAATKIIFATRLSDGIPTQSDYIEVIARGFEGYSDLRKHGISAIPCLHPLLTMRVGSSAEWRYLKELERKSQFNLSVRREARPAFGNILQKDMVTEIGKYKLLPRYTMRDPQSRIRDNEKNIQVDLTLAEAQRLVDLAVKMHNLQRLKIVPAAAVLGAAKHRLKTKPVDWLQFGLGVFKDAVHSATPKIG